MRRTTVGIGWRDLDAGTRVLKGRKEPSNDIGGD